MFKITDVGYYYRQDYNDGYLQFGKKCIGSGREREGETMANVSTVVTMKMEIEDEI